MRARPALLALVLALAGAAPATAAPPDGAEGARLDATVRYLQEAQNQDGGYAGRPGDESDPGISCWAAIALAAAGINPQDQKKPGGDDVMTFIRANMTGFDQTTDWERTLLAVQAAGLSGRDFGGVDLVAKILDERLPSGAISQPEGDTTGFVNSTAFAILALSQVEGPEIGPTVRRAADWLIEHQNGDGSWAGYSLASRPDTDMTGAVLEALAAAGRRDTPAQRRALGYLRSMQTDDGGFRASPGEVTANGPTTSWVVRGLWAAGEEPGTWTRQGGDPLSYLASLQDPDGGVRYRPGDDTTIVWWTAYAAPAYAGRHLPLPAVERAVPTPETPQPPATPAPPTGPPAPETGNGGVGGGAGGEAMTNGGGDGAGLFDAPQPQSRGRQRGGPRQLESAVPGRPNRRRPQPDSASPAAPATPVTPALPAIPPSGAAMAPLASAGLAGKLAPGGAGAPDAGAAASAASPDEISGKLIDGAEGTGQEEGAPSIRAADRGGSSTPWAVLGLLGLLGFAAVAGARAERGSVSEATS